MINVDFIALARVAPQINYLDPDGCWVWRGMTCNWGYGVMRTKGKQIPVHRFMYEQHADKIPEGMVVDHTCRNRLCQNPAHLQVITHGENAALGRLRRTHCAQGHEWTEENTNYRKDGSRVCRTCVKAQNHKQWLKRQKVGS